MNQPPPTEYDLGQHILTASGTFESVKPSAKMLVIVILAIFIVVGIREDDWGVMLERIPVVVLIWLGAVLLLRGLVQIMRVSVYTSGLQARSYWGFRRRFLWDSITEYRLDNSSGLAAIIVKSDSGKELWMLREIGERADFQNAVAPYFDWRSFLKNKHWCLKG